MNKNITLSKIVWSSLFAAVYAVAAAGCARHTEERGAEAPFVFTGYPIETQETLTAWERMDSAVSSVASSYNSMPQNEELYKRTGIKVQYITPPVGGDKEALNILLASGKLPDIISHRWLEFPGGPEKAIQDGYIIDMTQLWREHAPGIMARLAADPVTDKDLKTDKGAYYAFPFFRADSPLTRVFFGPAVRKEMLDQAGMEAPETVAEWEALLSFFKEKLGATAPLAFEWDDHYKFFIMAPFGVMPDFYKDENNIMRYGPYEDGAKEAAALGAKWYKNGWLDHNFMIMDAKRLDANLMSGRTGAVLAYISWFGRLMFAARQSAPDQEWTLVGTKWPVLRKGELARFGQFDNGYSKTGIASAVTSAAANPALAVRYLDYGYTPEGSLFYNFGVENKTYRQQQDGRIALTDFVLKNPEGLAPIQAIRLYSRGMGQDGPYWQDPRGPEVSEPYPEVSLPAHYLWSQTQTQSYQLGAVIPSPEDSAEFALIMNNVKTYVDENFQRFIIGSRSLETWDAYKADLERLGLKRALAIQQAALDRYLQR